MESSCCMTTPVPILPIWLETHEHLPSSPDLSPCDFYLFGDLKKDIRGRRFHSNEEVQKWLRLWIHQRPTSFTRLELIVSSPGGMNVLTLYGRMSLICGRMSPLTTIPTYQLVIKAPCSASPSGKSPECYPYITTSYASC